MSAKRYKTGDTVAVRTDLNRRERYGGIGISGEMVGFGGNILTIKEKSVAAVVQITITSKEIAGRGLMRCLN